MIDSIKYKNEEFSFPVFEYLYPSLLRCLWRYDLKFDKKTKVLFLKEEHCDELCSILIQEMNTILDEFYTEPEEETYTFNPNRFRKINVADKTYTLDYTTNPKDRVVFQIHSLFTWIRDLSERSIINDGEF